MLVHEIADETSHDVEDETSHVEETRRRTFLELESAEPELPFDHDEWHQFHDEDNAAGARVGKILGSLFLYTCVVMLLVAWWTFRSAD
jgi:hypothetical protein